MDLRSLEAMVVAYSGSQFTIGSLFIPEGDGRVGLGDQLDWAGRQIRARYPCPLSPRV